MGFCTEQSERHRALVERMLSHPFLLSTREGTIPFETFATWMRQDYLFVEAAIPFMAALLPKAPTEHWAPFVGVMGALEKELHLFEERSAAVGVTLRGAPAAFTTHAYIQFLLASAQQGSYAEGFTVLYAAEKAYHDSWRVVKEGLSKDSPWIPFVENWGGEDFATYVTWLEAELDRLAAAAGSAERERMAELYRTALLYEIAFWEMAWTGEGWPGVPESESGAAAEGPNWNPDPGVAVGSAWKDLGTSIEGRKTE